MTKTRENSNKNGKEIAKNFRNLIVKIWINLPIEVLQL
jgi:hypothetical protein